MKHICALRLLTIWLSLVLVGCSKLKSTVETIQWDGDCVCLEDFKLIEIDSVDCTSFPKISETLNSPFYMRLINDSIIVYSEIKEFNLLRIANLNTQKVTEALPVMVDGESGPMSTISQIMLADNKIWLADWKTYRVGVLENDYSARFDSMLLFAMPDDFYRIVPQKRNGFAYMPNFKENIRVEMLDASNNSSVLSKKFPPVACKESLNNMDVQVEMDVSPDMSYFVLSTKDWDFIEIYNDGEVKMMRGPFFNETRFVVRDKMKPYMTGTEKRNLENLRVAEECFAVGIADLWLDAHRHTVISDIKTVLIFSKEGKPLYCLSLPIPVCGFDIDYANNELITLEDYFNPKLKRYKINTPLVINQ